MDGGAPWYTTCRTRDGGHVAVGAVEKRFHTELLVGLGLADTNLPDLYDREGWPRLRAAFAGVFSTRSRDEWEKAFAGTDACVSPVLDMAEAAAHELAQARGAFYCNNDVIKPASAPRFCQSWPPPVAAQTGSPALRRRGIDADRLADLILRGTIRGQPTARIP